MRSVPWERLEILLEQGLELPTSERESFVERACAGDEELARELRGLLASAASSEGFLEPPGDGGMIGRRISSYRILRVLEVGGMGTVYLAEQSSPRREVALKVLSAGFSSPAVRRRFEVEAEILGRLHHPGIAQVHESGTTVVAGRELPWFAMEYVQEARTLLEYARGCSIDERLHLFVKVCDAVQHGHQRGVVHRDLKPSNVLVDRNGRPRVIDYGVARVRSDELSSETFETEAGALLGTLRYMSPEQLAGRPDEVDTRSDVYSLGVLLYELICETPPHAVDGVSFTEFARQVTQGSATRPSRHRPGVPADLDWVALRALEKERDRRYASCAELAADLGRFLRHQPVLARPPSRAHAARLFVRRNSLAVAVAAILSLAGLSVTVAFVRSRIERARELADANAVVLDREADARLSAYIAGVAAIDLALRGGDLRYATDALAAIDRDDSAFELRHLAARLDAGSVLLGRHGSVVRAIDFGPRGERVASASATGDVRVWAVDGSGESIRLQERGGSVQALRFHPGGGLLAVGDRSGAVRLWDTSSGELRSELDRGRDGATSLAFLANGQRLAVGTESGRIELWSLARSELLSSVGAHGARVLSLDASRDGYWMLSASWDNEVRLWEPGDEQPARVLLPMGDELPILVDWCARLDAAAERVICGPVGGGLLVLDLESGARLDGLYEHPSRANDLAVLPQGDLVAGAMEDGSLCLWNLATGRVAASRRAHLGPAFAIAVDARGERLATSGEDRTVRVWETALALADLDALAGHTSHVVALDLSPDGRRAVTGSTDGDAIVWDPSTGQRVATLRPPLPSYPSEVVFADDGARVVGLLTGRLVVWSADGSERVELERDNVYRHGRLAADGDRFAVAWGEGEVELWDASSLEVLARARIDGVRRAAVALSLRAGVLLVGGTDGFVHALSVPSLHPLDQLDPAGGPITDLALSPDGARVVGGSADRRVHVWELASGRLEKAMGGHSAPVAGVAFHPEGRRIASIDETGQVRLWDVETGVSVWTLDAHTEYGTGIAFDPDGQALISAGDYAARVWSTEGRSSRWRARRDP